MRGASHSHGTKPCFPLMCLGPFGIGRPTAGSPRRGCSHWAPHHGAVPLPLSMAFNHGLHFLPPSLCVSCRRSSLSLKKTKRCLTTLGLSYRKSSGPLQKVHCAGGRGPGANGFESSIKVSWDRVVEHGRDLRCCIAPRRFPSDGRHAPPVASCLRFRRFRPASTCCRRSHHVWKHLRVPSLSLRLVLGSLGLGMGAFHRVALLTWCSLWLFMSLGVGI